MQCWSSPAHLMAKPGTEYGHRTERPPTDRHEPSPVSCSTYTGPACPRRCLTRAPGGGPARAAGLSPKAPRAAVLTSRGLTGQHVRAKPAPVPPRGCATPSRSGIRGHRHSSWSNEPPIRAPWKPCQTPAPSQYPAGITVIIIPPSDTVFAPINCPSHRGRLHPQRHYPGGTSAARQPAESPASVSPPAGVTGRRRPPPTGRK